MTKLCFRCLNWNECAYCIDGISKEEKPMTESRTIRELLTDTVHDFNHSCWDECPFWSGCKEKAGITLCRWDAKRLIVEVMEQFSGLPGISIGKLLELAPEISTILREANNNLEANAENQDGIMAIHKLMNKLGVSFNGH